MVETHLLARLLGVRLLRVDGVVLLSPGRLESRPIGSGPAGVGADLSEAARLLEEADVTLHNGVDGTAGANRAQRGDTSSDARAAAARRSPARRTSR